MTVSKTAYRKRPTPPEFDPAGDSFFAPALDVAGWVRTHVLEPEGKLHNPDHAHLLQHVENGAVAFLWAAAGFTSKQRRVAGTAEAVLFRCNAWQKIRQEQQLVQWFGRLPDFLITLDAETVRNGDDATWCCLVEHECYHIAQLRDEFGSPMFSKATGLPKLGIRGHDVEEFVGIVRRYGMTYGAGDTAALVAAAARKPEITQASMRHACGTCLRLVA